MKITSQRLRKIIRESLENQELEMALAKMPDDHLMQLWKGMTVVGNIDSRIFAIFAAEFTKRGLQP